MNMMDTIHIKIMYQWPVLVDRQGWVYDSHKPVYDMTVS